MAESFFLDGGGRLADLDKRPLAWVSELRSVAFQLANTSDVGRDPVHLSEPLCRRTDGTLHDPYVRHALPENGIEHRLTKPNHPWTNRQVERMNRTLKEATVKRYHYDSYDQLKRHMETFLAAYNYAKRLKTLRGLTPYEYICKCWTETPDRFRLNLFHHTAGQTPRDQLAERRTDSSAIRCQMANDPRPSDGRRSRLRSAPTFVALTAGRGRQRPHPEK
jgi:hypothetical protein